MAFAVYRIPDSTGITLVKGAIKRYDPHTKTPDGFYINVFNTNEVFYIDPLAINTFPSFAESAGSWQKEIYLRPANAIKENAPQDYQRTLAMAIEAVEQNEFGKLVVSRNWKINDLDVDPAHVLDELSKAFPECLVYLYSTPFTGTWMGATPEKLLVKKSSHVFQVMALAGTIRSEKETVLNDWGEKEKKEQQLVEQFIEEIVKQKGNTYSKSAVYNFRTGLLNHLCTDFEVDLPTRKDFLQLATALHPTPAVGGLPREAAVHFLRSEEKYLRECYTGYLGPVGIHDQEMLYVNLRCCQLVENAVVFYAGGGINKGSVAEKESAEVENKRHNLQRFFR